MGKQAVVWKEYFVEYWLKEFQESMDRYSGNHDSADILLKMALNTIQLINQSINQSLSLYHTIRSCNDDEEGALMTMVDKVLALQSQQAFFLFTGCFLNFQRQIQNCPN